MQMLHRSRNVVQVIHTFDSSERKEEAAEERMKALFFSGEEESWGHSQRKQEWLVNNGLLKRPRKVLALRFVLICLFCR